ncbi:hypothetical protein EI94DRAFT_1763217 [Lactarius quietus]|nr:hypothetical protein EI94DRAFT_1763217 [Lactarius quietus]
MPPPCYFLTRHHLFLVHQMLLAMCYCISIPTHTRYWSFCHPPLACFHHPVPQTVFATVFAAGYSQAPYHTFFVVVLVIRRYMLLAIS